MDKDNPHNERRKRVRRRYEQEGNFDSFAPHEVLELVLYGGVPYADTNVMAHELITKFGSINAVFDASLYDLLNCGIKGLTYNAAISINSFKKVNTYLYASEAEDNFDISKFTYAYNYLFSKIGHFRDEHMFVVCLDKQFKIIHSDILAQGTPDAVTFFMRNLIKIVLDTHACSVILAHNHPSNNVSPSLADDNITRNAILALGNIGVQLIDHVIIGSVYGKYYAYSREEKIKDYYAGSEEQLRNCFITLRNTYAGASFQLDNNKNNNKE